MSTGMHGETVTYVSQRLLADHGGLCGLLRLNVEDPPPPLPQRLPSSHSASINHGLSATGLNVAAGELGAVTGVSAESGLCDARHLRARRRKRRYPT